jgi:sodium-dependent dicarboxylate transporter 2/3/5
MEQNGTAQSDPAMRTAASSGQVPESRDGSTEIDHRSPGEREPALPRHTVRVRWGGFVLGLVLAGIVYLLMPGDVANEARVTAATAVLMAAWWMTEAIPIPATALVPLVVFPVFNGVDLSEVGGSYGSDTIFLFMGGFLIALAMQKWNLHRRIALATLRVMGDRTSFMIAGFMIATGFLSMWVSNTATAVLMLPIGLSVLLLVNETLAESGAVTEPRSSDPEAPEGEAKPAVMQTRFATALMLAIAYSASIGSLGTIIGTPPNTFLVGYLRDNHDISIVFGEWMLVGVPVAVVMMAVAWFLLVKVLFPPEVKRIPGGRELISKEMAKLGPMSTGEWLVLGVFVLAALSWIVIPTVFEEPPISDAGIAMAVGLVLFVLPGGAKRGVRLLDWDTAVQMPWGVLLLFGGGLALSAQFTASGLSEWIGTVAEGLAAVPVVVLVAVLAAGILFLTEITSNTATAATFIPVVGGVAMGIGADVMLLTVPVALAATCAFMLPVATPPNAVAFGTGYVTIAQMVKGGLWLNLIGIVVITLATMTLAVSVFGIVF